MSRALAAPAALRDGEVEVLPLDEGVAGLVLAGSRDTEVTRWTQVPEGLSPLDARLVTAGWLGRVEHTVRMQVCVAGLGAVGMVTLWVNAAGETEVGYWLLAAARGRGIGSRAVQLVADWAFADCGVDRLQLTTLPGNVASERVAEHCGFSRDRTIDRDIKGTLRSLQLWVRVPGSGGRPPA